MRDSDKRIKDASLSNLAFYFDGLQRDRFDQGALNRRAAAWLGAREQLLRLPEEVYEVTIAAIQSLLAVGQAKADGDAGRGQKGNKGSDQHKRAAQRLYETTRQDLSGQAVSSEDLPTTAI